MADKSLRIAFFAQDFPPDVGGTHTYNIEYARRLCARGHDVRIFTWQRTPGRAAGVDAALPFEVHREPFSRPGRGIAAHGVADALRRWDAEVAFVSGGSGAVSLVARAAQQSTPTCISVHDLRDKGRDRGRFGRWRVRRRYGFDRAARITANSEHTRERLLRLGVEPERLAIVHPGVDLARFAPDPEAGRRIRKALGLGDGPVLLTVSRLAPNKGHTRVIEQLPSLRRHCPDIAYVVVGDGGMRAELEARGEALGVRSSLRFTGRVDDVAAYYNACDVFVMASSRHGGGAKAGEGFGIAYAEANACGKPAVASSSGGGSEIVIDGETGRVVDPDDGEGLEVALLELLTDRERARAFGARARERVRRYDWDTGAARLERVLRETADSRPSR